MQNVVKTIIILAAGMAVLSIVVSADTDSLYPTDDTYVYEATPTYNYGIDPDFLVGYGGSGWLNTLLKFDLVPYTDATINSAYLRLYVYYHAGDFPTDQIRITKNDADWDEGNVTWNDKPGFNGTINLSAPGVYGWWEVYVTTWVQDMVNGTTPNYGFQIYKGNTSTAHFYMYSKENSTNRPTLVLDYTPSAIECAALGVIKAAFR